MQATANNQSQRKPVVFTYSYCVEKQKKTYDSATGFVEHFELVNVQHRATDEEFVFDDLISRLCAELWQENADNLRMTVSRAGLNIQFTQYTDGEWGVYDSLEEALDNCGNVVYADVVTCFCPSTRPLTVVDEREIHELLEMRRMTWGRMSEALEAEYGEDDDMPETGVQ